MKSYFSFFLFFKSISLRYMRFWMIVLLLFILCMYLYSYINKDDRQELLIELDTVNFYNPEFDIDLYLNDRLDYRCSKKNEWGYYHYHQTELGDWLQIRYKADKIFYKYAIPPKFNEQSFYYRRKNRNKYVYASYDNNLFDRGEELRKSPFVITKIKSYTKDLHYVIPENYRWGENKYTNGNWTLYSEDSIWEYYYSSRKNDSIALLHYTNFAQDETISQFNYDYRFFGDFFNDYHSSFHFNIKFRVKCIDIEKDNMSITQKLPGSAHFTMIGNDELNCKITFHHKNDPLVFISLEPEPDIKTSTMIQYSSPEKIENIFNDGLTIYAEKIEDKQRNDSINLILATLIGILCSVLVEIGLKKWIHK